MADDPSVWDTMIRGLVEGNGQAYCEFWSRYGERLNRIAGRHLPKHFHRRVQPEDVVQSVCRTFFRRMSEGYFELGNVQQLWPLLCAMTLNKVRMQVRFQLREKRHPAREVGLSQEHSSTGGGRPERDMAANDIDPQEAVAFAEQLELIMAGLDDEERQIVQLRLDGYDSQDIARRLQCSTRTVRRITSRIRERLARELSSDVSSRRDHS